MAQAATQLFETPTINAQDEIARLLAENAKLKAKVQSQATAKLRVKLGKKPGVVHVTGINGKYGVALYGQQWHALLNFADTISDFLDANPEVMADSRDKD